MSEEGPGMSQAADISRVSYGKAIKTSKSSPIEGYIVNVGERESLLWSVYITPSSLDVAWCLYKLGLRSDVLEWEITFQTMPRGLD